MALPPDWTSPAMREAFERAFKEACKSGVSNVLISSGNPDRPPTATETRLREMLQQPPDPRNTPQDYYAEQLRQLTDAVTDARRRGDRAREQELCRRLVDAQRAYDSTARPRHIRAVWNGRGHPTIEAMVTCQYCDQPAEMVDGAHLYPHYPDLAHRMYYKCKTCEAWVGTHERDNETPYGELANGQLRRLRILAHDAFDNYWPLVVRTRNQGYAWLAEQMGLPEEECHIGGFGINECQEVIDMCTDTYEHFDDFEDLTINRDVEDLLE